MMLRLLLVSLATLAGPHARALIEGTLNGDRKATRALLKALTPVIQSRVRALLRRIFTSIQQDDLVQEVWISLLAHDGRLLRGYDGERPLEAYVGVLARRAAKDVVRQSVAQKRGGVMVHAELPQDSHLAAGGGGDAVEAQDLFQSLMGHLESYFKGRGKLVMRCLYSDGRSVPETAELLGMTRNAVSIWQTKIRKAAKDYLNCNEMQLA